MPRAFMYVVDRDFGFAPNPFHGICTLATCKPRIRRAANLGDWVIGMGGARLRATGRCIFAMEVSEKIAFNEYWSRNEFADKRPVRNGSLRMLVGDNIYHRAEGRWIQADSHHSLEDGSANIRNVVADTSADAVLVSDRFYYFGLSAPIIPSDILNSLGYSNGRNHRTFPMDRMRAFLKFLHQFPICQVLADPFDFFVASSRYSGIGSRLTRNS